MENFTNYTVYARLSNIAYQYDMTNDDIKIIISMCVITYFIAYLIVYIIRLIVYIIKGVWHLFTRTSVKSLLELQYERSIKDAANAKRQITIQKNIRNQMILDRIRMWAFAENMSDNERVATIIQALKFNDK